MSRRIAIIDADSIVYILGYHAREHQEIDLMKKLVDEFMIEIIQATGTDHYLGVFSPKETFRHRIATIKQYKGNRPSSPDWYKYWSPIIKEYCIEQFGFFIAEDIEADDVLSIMRNGTQPGDEVVLCSPDKDMKQIPGKHYNYAKKLEALISPEEGRRNLLTQIIVGDTSDNITGIKGVGPKGAEQVLSGDPNGWEEAVQKAFEKVYKEGWLPVYQEIVSLVQLVQPTDENVKQYESRIQKVLMDDRDEVAEILNAPNDDNEGLLRSDQRSYEDDILRPPLDFSEQV